MRLPTALAVLSLLLAGCAASDDPTPPNADPIGNQTLPPASSTGTTAASTETRTPTPSSSSSSASSTGTATGAGFRPHGQEDSAGDADFSGLAVHGRLLGSGDAVRIEATASKFSPAQYKVPDGACAQPWTEAMLGPDGPVQHRQPAAACQAFGLRPMQDNEAISVALAWDGTLWDASAQAYVPAPSGPYEWQATFHVYSGGSGSQFNESADLTLRFAVEVP